MIREDFPTLDLPIKAYSALSGSGQRDSLVLLIVNSAVLILNEELDSLVGDKSRIAIAAVARNETVSKRRNNSAWIKQEKGKLVRYYADGGREISKLDVIGDTKKTGTVVWFKPNTETFSTTVFNFTTIAERLRESAFLLKGLKMTLIDERSNTTEEYLYHDGII